MKTLPPVLVLFATALFAASFGACGGSELESQSDSQSEVLSEPPEAPSTSTRGSKNWQTDLAFVPQHSYATTVSSVIDGDTIRAIIDGKQTNIRLIGIDTPESSTSTRPEECGGAEATNFLHNILPPGTPILLTRDQELLDPYDRLLAYVHRQSNGLFVNLAMAKYGMASELSFPPNTRYKSHIQKAVATARRAGIGVWGLCGTTDREL